MASGRLIRIFSFLLVISAWSMRPSRDSFSSSKERSTALGATVWRSLDAAAIKSILRFENIRKFRFDEDPTPFINKFFTTIMLPLSKSANIKSIKFNLSILYDKVNEPQNNCTEDKFNESEIVAVLIKQICQNLMAELEFQKRTAKKKREKNE